MKKKKYVLIVGGFGQVGKELTEHLLEKGHQVHIVTNKKVTKNKKNFLVSNFDISSRAKVFNFLKRNNIDSIYFLASHNISSTEKEIDLMHENNIKTNVISLTNFLNYICSYNNYIYLIKTV